MLLFTFSTMYFFPRPGKPARGVTLLTLRVIRVCGRLTRALSLIFLCQNCLAAASAMLIMAKKGQPTYQTLPRG